MRVAVSIFLFAAIILLPDVAQAQLVQCQGLDCDMCDFVNMINRIIQFIIAMFAVLATVLLAVAGVKLIASGGDQGALEQAKKMFVNVVIGLILVLAAWMIINVILEMLTGRGLSFWGTTSCGYMVQPIYSDPDVGIMSGGDAGIGGGGGVAGADSITPTGNLTTYSGARFDEAIVSNIEYLDTNFDLAVSGGHRTVERNREVNGSPTSYHLYGRAGDFTGSSDAMKAGRDWALANGAKEAIIHDAGSGTHLHVAW